MAACINPLSDSRPWDRVAKGYAQDAWEFSLPFARVAAQLARLTVEDDVLDVAAGPGTLALEVAPSVRSVHAVDFSEPMLVELARNLAKQQLSNVRVLQADGQALPFGAQFHAAFSIFGLMFFPDRAAGFRELHRVLIPGGRAVVSCWAPVSESPVISLMFGALQAAHPATPEPTKGLVPLEHPEGLAREMREAGFTAVEVCSHVHRFESLGSAEALWARMCRSSAPLSLLAESLGPDKWAEQSRIALDYLRSELPKVGELTTKAHLAVGHR